MKKIKNALFPGSFDPLHEGHIDIIKRSSKLFNNIFVAVSYNVDKTQDDVAVRFLKVRTKINSLKIKNVKVILNKGLTIDLAKKRKCQLIIRSVRNLEDLNYEINMAQFNFSLDSSIETIFLVANPILSEVSSTSLKEVKNKLKIINKK